MEYRYMGKSGLRVSEFCLGTMTFGSQTTRESAFEIMDIAYDAGVNFIDTADSYPNFTTEYGITEEIVGDWLGRHSRDSIVLATKCQNPVGSGPNDQGLSRSHIHDAVDKSLRRLKTDYIDLYQSHFPDPGTPIDETMLAFDDLIRAGKVRYIGSSNYRTWEMAQSLIASDRLGITRYQCTQQRYNILYRDIDSDLLPLCQSEGIGVIAYNPLAGGLLTAKYRSTEDLHEGTRFTMNITGSMYRDRYWSEEHFREVLRLQKHFSDQGISITKAAIAWILRQPGITAAIVGASRREQIEETLQYKDVDLSEEDLSVCGEAWLAMPRRPETSSNPLRGTI